MCSTSGSRSPQSAESWQAAGPLGNGNECLVAAPLAQHAQFDDRLLKLLPLHHRVISLRHALASLAVLMRRQSTRLHQCRMSWRDTPASAAASAAVITPRANRAKAARLAGWSFICQT